MSHTPSPNRYSRPDFYRRCGRSGLMLPIVSLGIWHNFGEVDDFENARAMVLRAFDLGITHLDAANTYGPPPGSAERNLGKILRGDLAGHRDELVIATKAGWTMWPGPYGDWGSRKYLIASLDQSLGRLGVDYVDIYYSHRRDPKTPLEETMGALSHAVRSGKALYAGISMYSPEDTLRASKILRDLGTPCLIHQPCYNIFDRSIEGGLLDVLGSEGIGGIAFCPLAQGLLTDRYFQGIPKGSRASKSHSFLRPAQVTDQRIAQARRLGEIAKARGQTLAQMALAWVMRQPQMTSVLIGASSAAQIEENVAVLKNMSFDDAELGAIDAAVRG
jgi:L-glyceraldehyde 3-phosphate reductase